MVGSRAYTRLVRSADERTEWILGSAGLDSLNAIIVVGALVTLRKPYQLVLL